MTVSQALERSNWTISSSTNENIGNAIDGSLTTRWSTRAPQASGQFFQIDLGQVHFIDSILIDSEASPQDSPREYSVFTSLDGSDWGGPIASGIGSGGTSNINFSAQYARYIKIEQTGADPFFWWSIHEVNIFSAPQSTVQLDSTNWVLNASNPGNTGSAGNTNVLLAIDGDDSTRWTTTQAQTTGQYFEIDLGSQVSFDEIILDSASSPRDDPRGYSVHVSSTPFGANLGTAIAEGFGSADGLTIINFKEQLARYIRIVQTGSAARNWWSIHELSIFNIAGNPGPVNGDTDSDGITDDNDFCPNTPLGTAVDETGCPIVLTPTTGGNILVFSKTQGFEHRSIPAGITMLEELASENGWSIEFTDNDNEFNADRLSQFNAVVWLNTTGNVLNNAQQDAFENYIENGGGYVGIHSAADTEYDWPWYGDLVGAYFNNHPEEQTALMVIEDNDHPSTAHLNDSWTHFEEWYNYQTNPRSNVNVLMSVDEATYSPGNGAMGDHPISWYKNIGAGRSFYTGLGHDDATYDLPEFRQHISGAINWAGSLASNAPQWIGPPPVASDFESINIASGLNVPIAFDIAQNGEMFAIGRFGSIYAMQGDDFEETSTISIGDFEGGRNEGGLIGFVLDPNFTSNRYGYFHYTLPNNSANVVSRIQINNDGSLNRSSERVLLNYPFNIDACCHMAGDLEFDNQGNLYVSTGDNTTPFGSDGYTPIDERRGQEPEDAQKSSSNTNSLSGKILRIKPTAAGSYTIPPGNLFSNDNQHRGEIFVMGNRNPFRIAIDSATDTLFWGDIGPDANSANNSRGPTGYDEINRTNAAGNFGWPYFSGENEAYNDYNFATNTSAEKFNPLSPVNDSPNNTGATILPSVIPSWIKLSHRATMVADVYRWNAQIVDEYKFPSYFNGHLIYWNFNNDEMFSASVADESPELYNWLMVTAFKGVIDAKISPVNNRLYILGYGNNCCGSTPGQGGLAEIRYIGEPIDSALTRATINAGGNAFSSSNNIEFSSDRFFSAGQQHASGNAIAGTDNDEVFSSHHWNIGNFSYNVPMTNGEYTVELMFAEVFFSQAGRRVFSVNIEDQASITNLDVFAEVGANNALSEVFNVSVRDGSLDIEFTPTVENPMISGIRILPKSVVDIGSELSISAGANGLFLTADNNGFLVAAGFSDNNDSAIEVRAGINGGVSFYSIALGRYLSVTDGLLNFNATNVGLNQSFRVTSEGESFGIIALSNNLYFTLDTSENPALVLVNGPEFTDASTFNIQASDPCDLSEAGEHGIDCRPAAKAYMNFPKNPDNDFTGIPTRLSQTGAFTNVTNMTPADNLIPYDMVSPLWSDRAKKDRWVSIPSGTKVEYFEQGKWKWPAGTVFIKHFALPTDEQNENVLTRLETRFVIVKEDGDIYAVTYKWRPDNSDADLLTDGLEEDFTIQSASGSYTQTWSYPSPADCVNCHNEDAQGILGPKTASLNGNVTYPSGVTDNQLSTLNHLNIFVADIDEIDLSRLPRHAALDDESASLELRVRSYWDSNCAHCHGPRGIASLWDARFETSLLNQGVINGEVADQRDYFEEYGLPNPLIVDPNNADNSILFIRDQSIDPDDKMPPLGKNLEDTEYISVLQRWIDSLN